MIITKLAVNDYAFAYMETARIAALHTPLPGHRGRLSDAIPVNTARRITVKRFMMSTQAEMANSSNQSPAKTLQRDKEVQK